jgi:hypothetical protein
MKPTTLPELFMLKIILILTTLPKVFILKLRILCSQHQRMSNCLLKVKTLPQRTALLMLMMSLLL